MDFLHTFVDQANTLIWATPAAFPLLIVVLLGTGLITTAALGVIQVRRLPHAFAVVAGKYDDPDHKGDVSHFQALSTALSATVGIGNIAGVATAIHLGGPGALFWMWLTAAFGMALKYAECTLSMHYRTFDDDGDASGGPMYYIEKGLGPRFGPLAKGLAVLFAVAGVVASFGGGNMSQANTVAVSASMDFGARDWLVGIILAVVVGVVILGGIRRIAAVSSKLAPGMAILYVAGALVVIGFNITEVPAAFAAIVKGAFSPEASLGGSVAGGLMTTLLWGVKRGLFSNEAGQGSAPIAHAAARTDEPVREGVVAMLGPLIDTLLICTMTGLVIVTTGVWDDKFQAELQLNEADIVLTSDLGSAETEYERIQAAVGARAEVSGTIDIPVQEGRQKLLAIVGRDGLVDEPVLLAQDGSPWSGTATFDPKSGTFVGDDVPLRVSGAMLLTSSVLTAQAFQTGLSSITPHGNLLVTLAVFLFAVSTMISWSYYGDRCVTYLLGSRWVLAYRVVYTLFVFLGSVLALELVWAYGDLALGLMALPNLVAIVLLLPKVLEVTREYFARMDARA